MDYSPGKYPQSHVTPTNPALPVVTMRDVGPEADLEWQSGAVQSVEAEDLCQGQQHKVKKDAKGRALAPCGCLLQTLPPDPPSKPPFTLNSTNTEEAQAW